MAKGYTGKILWADLSNGSLTDEPIGDDIYQKYLCGYGLGAKVVWDKQKGSGIDPLGEENILGFVSGLLTGSGAFFSGRYMVVGKSPLTGTWGDANAGGYFSPEIKKAGYDGIFFVGKAEKPVYLQIADGKAELKDASHLWGKDSIETEEIIREETGVKKMRVAAIGESGEKLSLISGIVNDRGRIAARSGLGAVMGSKKLKAVAVSGKKRPELHDKKLVMELNKKFLAELNKTEKVGQRFSGSLLNWAGKLMRKAPVSIRQDAPLWREILRKFGTGGITTMSSESGDTPVKNWAGAGYYDFPMSTHSHLLGGDKVIHYEKKKYHCYPPRTSLHTYIQM